MLPAVEQQQPPAQPVVDAAEIRARADRPVDRRGVDAQHVLDLAHQVQRVATEAVHLVDEGEDRDAAHATDLEQLARLRLDALGGVDQHHRAVRGGQRAVGVLAEVVVARGVEDVDPQALRARRSSPSC